ncbi:MAG TPA: class I SAM-dependent methyltransferase [Candidatus Saccharimonadales bacterium]|nr:class I SAM-dependent methyltransferase [Candidatus Saccharimonadales bacterium]
MERTNNYDDFAAEKQKRLREGMEPPHRFVEKPAMQKLLPDLTGKHILLIGCGTGEETVILEQKGAVDITGIDISAESVRLARQAYPQYTFLVGDMHHLDFPDSSFDFVYSSLAVHYSATPANVYKEMYRVLKPQASLQFSTVHPVRYSSAQTEIDGKRVRLLGYSEDYENSPVTYGDYLNFQEYSQKLPHGGETIQYWAGPPSMHFQSLQDAGFQVTHFIETKATEEAKTLLPFYYERFSKFPQFVVFAAQKL